MAGIRKQITMSANRRGFGMSTVTAGLLKSKDFTLDRERERGKVMSDHFPTQCGTRTGLLEEKDERN